MKVLNLPVENLRRLDRTTGGALHVALQEQLRAGHDPEVVVRREIGAEGSFPRWTISIVTIDEPTVATFEIDDAHGVAVLGGIWLADLRAEVAEDVRRRLEAERTRS